LGVEELEVRGQLAQLVPKLRVADFVHEQVLELLAHVGRHGVEQVLHLRHLALHLLDQLFEILGRVVAEKVAVLLHELVEVRLAAGHLLGEHLVQVADHVLHALHVLGRHVRDLGLEVAEEGIHHGLLQHLHKLLELRLGLGVHELVVLQLFHLAAEVLG